MEQNSESSQDDQINSIVVGRGVKLRMGEPIDGLSSKSSKPVTASAPFDQSDAQTEVKETESEEDLQASADTDTDADADADAELDLLETQKPKKASKKLLEKKAKTGKKQIPKKNLIAASLVVLAIVGFGAVQLTRSPKTEVASDLSDLAAKAPRSQGGSDNQQRTDVPGDVLQRALADSDLSGEGSSGTRLPAQLTTPPPDQGPLPSGQVSPIVVPAPATMGNTGQANPVVMPRAQAQANSNIAEQAKPTDKHNSAMDIGLGGDSATSADLAQLKNTPAASTAGPSSQLSKPLQEIRPESGKQEVKPQQKQEGQPESKQNLEPQAALKPAAGSSALKLNKAAPTVAEVPAAQPVKPVVKAEKKKPEVSVRVAESAREKPKAKAQKDNNMDDEASGFALPIREVHANGRPVAQAQKSSSSDSLPIKFAEPRARTKESQGVEVVHVESGFALITNPASQLPMRIKVGESLPNGATVKSIDPAKGVINTNNGTYGMR